MSLSQPRVIYGINSVTFYKLADLIPYGTLRVLGGSTLTLGGELVQLTGGSSKYPWAAEDGNISAEMSLKLKEIPDWLFEVFLGKAPTTIANSAANVSALANVLNASLQDAATGIASVGVKSGSEADVKFGKYIVKAVTPTTVDVYGVSSVDFNRGTDKEFVDDTLKITPTPLTITTGIAVELPGFGVELTGGSGTIAMTADDTAEFDANPASTSQTDVSIGGINDCIPEFGAFVTAQKRADGSMWQFQCFKVKGFGFPFGMEEKAFNEAEITATLLYDPVKNAVLKAKYLKPTIVCS